MQTNPQSLVREFAQRASLTSCRQLAYDLHARYQGNYPLFWESIAYDQEKLADIFEFFCAMQVLLGKAPSSFMSYLHQRLAARMTGDPPPFPSNSDALIQQLSEAQAAAITRLGNLCGSGFDLFAAGALAGRVQWLVAEPPSIEIVREAMTAPHPDGAAFFYWTEFAFVAASAGHDIATWRATIPILLRAERIYTLAYGGPVQGMIPITRRFHDYCWDSFRRVHPNEVASVSFASLTRFDVLEAAATECARFAFPGHFT